MKTNDPISGKQANRSKIGKRPPRKATPRKRLACRVKTHFDASAAALDPGDWMYPQYRESGIIFWRGYTTQEFIHHMFCNAEDIILG